MDEIRGDIENIIFRNIDTHFTVFEAYCDEKIICCVGKFDSIAEGEYIIAKGEYVNHNVYGKQFKISEYKIEMPEDIVSIEKYLASGAISGIGATIAKRIIDMFAEETFKIMEEEPERLSEIKGISERKARDIAQQFNEKRGMRDVVIYLQKYGITNALSVKIYEKYGLKTYAVMQENPYRIAEDIVGVGFKTVDEIAKTIGIHLDSDYRITSGILYTLFQIGNEGHICMPKDELIDRATLLLGVSEEGIAKQLMNMVIDKKVIIKEIDNQLFVYSSAMYYMEIACAQKILDLNIKLINDTPESDNYIKEKVDEVQNKSNLEMDEEQSKAVIESLKNGVTIVTGGPGTGKTTIINSMISIFIDEDMDVLLAAPTGRAAKRMTETTGYEAKTIHRLLELNGGGDNDGGMVFGRGELYPLEADVIIIDEASMIDIYIFSALLKAITVGTRLIMVGDVNQLPSVGPGQILSDLIASNLVPVTSLKKIFRQSLESDIVKNAHAINGGENLDLKKKSKDFLFMEKNDYQLIYKNMVNLVVDRLPAYINGKSQDIQVLTPMKNGPLGAVELNRILQHFVNPKDKSKKELVVGEKTFRVGDKVMQIRNNYQLEWEIVGKYNITVEQGQGVFNGDIGVVEDVNDYSRTIRVLFDEQKVVYYSQALLTELELAYAITIHKSQGSEYNAVLIPLLQGPRLLMNRNLLYTAITRAKKCVIILGDSQVVAGMIANESEKKRYTSLDNQMKEIISNK